MTTLTEFGVCQWIQQYAVVIKSYYVSQSIRLCLEVENDEYIMLCNFGGRSMDGFKVKEGPLLGHTKQQIRTN